MALGTAMSLLGHFFSGPTFGSPTAHGQGHRQANEQGGNAWEANPSVAGCPAEFIAGTLSRDEMERYEAKAEYGAWMI